MAMEEDFKERKIVEEEGSEAHPVRAPLPGALVGATDFCTPGWHFSNFKENSSWLGIFPNADPDAASLAPAH